MKVALQRVMTNMGADAGFTTKYEEYPASNQDTVREFFAAAWQAQGFTPASGHTLNGVKLPLFREGTIGEVTVSIQADSGGDPDGTDLSLTTFPGMDLPLTSSTVRFISLPAVLLTVSTLYHIVVRLAGGDSSNSISWDEDSSTATYAGGSRNDSANSGNTWSPQTGVDMIFEEWGFA